MLLPVEPTPSFDSQRPLDLSDTRLPSAKVELAQVNTILFIVPQGRLEQALPNVMAVAAIHRAVTLERGSAPALKLLGATQLTNWCNGQTTLSYFDSLRPHETTLLLAPSAMSRRKFAVLAGTYLVNDAVLAGKPGLIPDSTPLGQHPLTAASLAPLAQTLAGSKTDPTVQDLLNKARGTWPSPADAALQVSLQSALSALQTKTGLWALRERREPIDPNKVLEHLIVELSAGSQALQFVQEYGAEYSDALAVASSIWAEAQELRPGVFQLHGPPPKEWDALVRRCLIDLYSSDDRAHFIIEKNPDRGPTALSCKEATAFLERIRFGEPPSDILAEVEEILHARGDTATYLQIELARDRDRSPLSILEPILNRSQYVPDADGVFTLVKHPEQSNLADALTACGVTMVDHLTMWLVDPKTGHAQRTTIAFQASQLERFLNFAR